MIMDCDRRRKDRDILVEAWMKKTGKDWTESRIGIVIIEKLKLPSNAFWSFALDISTS